MKVLVVGSGGREHALAWKLFASPLVDALACAPGNAGTALLGPSLDVQPTDVDRLVEAARQSRADLTIVGPEAPLAAGIVDRFTENDLRIFGPTRAAARIEWSKAWAKDLMQRSGIPTGRAEVVDSTASGQAALRRLGLPVAIKADGLAAGKGVFVVRTEKEAADAFEALFERRDLGEAGALALVEEFLPGRELSVMAFTDGERLAIMPPARDYKRLGDGDAGPNTGGMGGYTRPLDATPDLLARVEREVLQPTLRALAAAGSPFRGVLYAGLMLTPAGLRVLEFNCRFGDPEAQLILPLLESDLAEICESVIDGRLNPRAVRWGGGVTCGVVLAAPGYPSEPSTGSPIEGLDDLEPGVLAFHSGTRTHTTTRFFGVGSRSVVTAGGRVLTIVATGPSLDAARALAYESVEVVRFEGRQLRTDIGRDAGVGPAVEPQPSPSHEPEAAPPPGGADPPAPTPAAAPAAPAATGAAVLLLVGEPREQPLLAETVRILGQVGLIAQVVVLSAYRVPAEAEARLAAEVRAGAKAAVVTAGVEPALPGLVAGWSGLPTIAVPVEADDRATADALVAATQVPPRVPVAVVAPGERGARTAAWMAASIAAQSDPVLGERLAAQRQRQAGTES